MKYDVVKEYDWCSSPRGSGMRKRAPRVWVKSYKLTSNNITTALKNYLNIWDQKGGDAKTFYDKMYGEVTIAEDDFNFPFFGDNIRSFTNTFGDTFQNGVGGAGVGTAANELMKTGIGMVIDAKDVAGLKMETVTTAGSQMKNKDFSGGLQTLAKGFMSGGDPGSYVETPQFYQFDKTDSPLQVSFILSNTINEDSLEKNKNLIYRLTYINRPLRKNSIAVDPPRIYQVKVPGHRFIKWAYCSNFSVNLLGTKREYQGVIVPEAYQIDMSFQSLTLEHAGFMKELV